MTNEDKETLRDEFLEMLKYALEHTRTEGLDSDKAEYNEVLYHVYFDMFLYSLEKILAKTKS